MLFSCLFLTSILTALTENCSIQPNSDVHCIISFMWPGLFIIVSKDWFWAFLGTSNIRPPRPGHNYVLEFLWAADSWSFSSFNLWVETRLVASNLRCQTFRGLYTLPSVGFDRTWLLSSIRVLRWRVFEAVRSTQCKTRISPFIGMMCSLPLVSAVFKINPTHILLPSGLGKLFCCLLEYYLSVSTKIAWLVDDADILWWIYHLSFILQRATW